MNQNPFNSIRFAFIDSQNLNLSIQNSGWKLDFEKFRIFLKNKYDITKAFLFLGYVKEYQDMYKYLSQIGYTLIFKPTLGKIGTIKGNCDAELVLHCAKIEYNHYDSAIIVSGDGDFYCLIEFLIAENKLFKIGIPNRKRFSSLLIPFREYFFFVSDVRHKLEYKKSHSIHE